MSYVFELTFDPATETAIRTIWQRISDAGHPSSLHAQGYRPHISLAVYDSDVFDIDACYKRAEAYAREARPFPVRLSHLGVFIEFENVVFLGVTPSEALLDHHRNVLQLCEEEHEQLRAFYAPGWWTPHVTLGFDLTRQQALDILAMGWEMSLPDSGWLRALHLVELTPDYARDIFTCEYRG